jgi:hypothetical protein
MRAAQRRAAASPPCEQFVTHRIVDDADLDFVSSDTGDRDAEMRHAASEIHRAVDGIDNPSGAALACGAGLALFANEAVGRKNLEQALRDERFRLSVNFSQKVLRTLEADRERLVQETAPRHRAGLARDRLRREQPHLRERGSAVGHRFSVKSGCKSPARRRPGRHPRR